MRFDGRENLRQVLRDAGFGSLTAAVAKLTLFLHPDTVKQTQNTNLFRIVRGDKSERGTIAPYNDSVGKVLVDDNTGPTNVFSWAIGHFNYRDIQVNHIYRDSRNVAHYTCAANLCVTPAFLAKLTDADDAVVATLRYRAYDIYGFFPSGTTVPPKPDGYDNLVWHPFADAVTSVERTLRDHMATKPRSRSTLSATQIGWLFSGFEPDSLLIKKRAA